MITTGMIMSPFHLYSHSSNQLHFTEIKVIVIDEEKYYVPGKTKQNKTKQNKAKQTKKQEKGMIVGS